MAAALMLAACQNDIQVRGNIPDPEVVQEIRAGVHGRNDVASLLGSPSAVSTFEDDIWYYIGQKTAQFAFFKPDIRERQVLVVSFDPSGRVGETKTYTLADSRDIDPVDRETPTEGRNLTILQQIFGNIGRFDGETLTN
jgi:outer membrane protein assembly factor BamE (lipoprotein component of BamABCDE complex)